MTYQLFEHMSFVRHFAPLFCGLALGAGGLIMIASANIRMRAEQMTRRVALAQTGAGAAAGRARLNAPEENQRNAAAYGISEAEHRQIVRLSTKFGIAADRALPYFMAGRIGLALSLGGIVFMSVASSMPWLTVLIAVAAMVCGWFLPMMIIGWKLKRHSKSVGTGLPGGLELLAICVEAGLSLDHGLLRVARELKDAQPALSEELSLTWAEISILPSRDQALANLAARVDLPSVRSVVSTLAQSLRFGSPLAQSLRNAAEEMRHEQLMQLEERANRLPALMTVPVMLFIMPTIFLIVGGPAVLRLMDIFNPAK